MSAVPPSLSAEVKAHYPWTGNRFELPDGAAMHYLDEGSGHPIVMVHGNPTWSFYYRHLVRELSGEHRCIVPDHIGMGLSDKPQDYPYSIRQHIENLTALLEHLDIEHATLVVHDWGGPIGFGAAERLASRFDRFIVFNTALFQGPMPLSIGMCRVPGLGPLLIQGLNGFVRGGLIRAISDRSRMKNGVGAGYLAPYDSWAHRRAQQNFINEIPTSQAHHNYALLAELDAGSAVFREHPMLMIWGERDFCFTPWFREGMQRRFPAAEVHPLADAAHFVIEDAHERILPLIRDFFARHPVS